jgi:hypothetical protein
VFRPRYRKSISLFFAAFIIFFGCAAAFSSKNNGALAVLAVLSGLCICGVWRSRLFVEPTGVKIILTFRLAARTIPWNDIDRFEKRSAAGQSPVTLVLGSDQRAITVPTFPKPRRPIPPKFKKYHALVQEQVDELNALLNEHRRLDVPQEHALARQPAA